MPSTFRPVILWGLALAGSIGAAQAQSSYVLTKLTEPFLGQLDAEINSGQIDSQNRVTANARYVSGFRLYNWGAAPGFTYTTHVSRWPASTSTSVSASKLISQAGAFNHQSPDGSKVFTFSSPPPGQYYDAEKRQFVSITAPINSTRWSITGINDSGAVAGNADVYLNNATTPSERAIRWAPGAAAPAVLPIGSEFDGAGAWAINRKGAIAGEAREAASQLQRAVVWRETGSFDVLNREPGTHSRALGLSDSGDVLVWIDKAASPDSGYAVVSNGVTHKIKLPSPGQWLANISINANGLVSGTVNQPDVPQGLRERGFIWKDGVFTDLTAWVVSKGLKLPQGTVIAKAWQINTQGSILASMREADGKITMVRLTAKP